MTTDSYGPNSAEVEKLLTKIKEITPTQAEKLWAAWYAIEGADRATAEFESLDATHYERWIAVRHAAMEAMPDDAGSPPRRRGTPYLRRQYDRLVRITPA